MSSGLCYHCDEPVPNGPIFTLNLDGQERAFCCPACRAIAQTIHDNGLDQYYSQRENSAFTPTQSDSSNDYGLWDDAAINREFVSIDDGIATAQLYIEGMHCTSCAWLIERYLQRFDDVTARVNYQQQVITLTWPIDSVPLSQLMQAVASLGYHPHPYEADRVEELEDAQNRSQIKRIGITAILMMQLGMLALGVYAGDFFGISHENRQLLHAFGLLFSLPLIYFSAQPFLVSAYHSLKNRRINMDVNISFAIIGLYGGSIASIIKQTGDVYFDSIAMLCLFILIARFIEFRSRYRLRQHGGLIPKFAKKWQADTESFVDTLIQDIEVDDLVLVNQGETFALDGTVETGHSSADESMLTGEPEAVKKLPGDTVYAGAINHDGVLQIRVAQKASNSLIKQIETACACNASEKPQLEDDDTVFAGTFTSVVLLLSVVSFFVWQWIDPERAFWVALSVLVISCPCALSLAAPTARSCVQFRLRRQGIIVRGAHVIDTLNKITHCFFDKTGTLTRGKYQIVTVDNLSDLTTQALLNIAGALEKHSNHPVAHAFSADIDHQHADVTDMQLVPNQGVYGTVEDTEYRLGSVEFCQQWHPDKHPPNRYQLWVGLCTRDAMLAWFCLADNLRNETSSLVDALRQRHLKLGILSGDSSEDVANIAKTLGIENWHNAMTSEQKHLFLEEAQRHGHVTMMVGDGINDAPSLAGSHLSVTLANASDWLKSQTDIVLVNNRLDGITAALDAAVRYKKIYTQNFYWALFYNIAAIPIAMAGFSTLR